MYLWLLSPYVVYIYTYNKENVYSKEAHFSFVLSYPTSRNQWNGRLTTMPSTENSVSVGPRLGKWEVNMEWACPLPTNDSFQSIITSGHYIHTYIHRYIHTSVPCSSFIFPCCSFGSFGLYVSMYVCMYVCTPQGVTPLSPSSLSVCWSVFVSSTYIIIIVLPPYLLYVSIP